MIVKPSPVHARRLVSFDWTDTHRSPMKEGAFAWSDPNLPGSRLDPQTADFAWRAAELWTQAAGLREHANAPGFDKTTKISERRSKEDGDSDTGGSLAWTLQHVSEAFELHTVT